MFTNVEEKLKSLAKINCACGMVLAILGPLFIIGIEDDWIIPGLLAAVLIVLIALVQSWFIYAFAELLETTKRTTYILQIAHKEDIAVETERQKQTELERVAQEEEEQRRAMPVTLHYWDKTPEEEEAKRKRQAAREDKRREK